MLLSVCFYFKQHQSEMEQNTCIDVRLFQASTCVFVVDVTDCYGLLFTCKLYSKVM